MSRSRGAGLSLVQACLLTLWLGAALFFAAVVAPASFRVLPEPSHAGMLVGRLLPPLFVAGLLAGAAVLVIELWRGRGRSRLRVGGALVMLVTCALAHFVIGSRIDRLRAAVGRPLSSLARDDARRVAFGRLHGLSVAGLGAAILGAAAAIAGAARPPAGGGTERGA